MRNSDKRNKQGTDSLYNKYIILAHTHISLYITAHIISYTHSHTYTHIHDHTIIYNIIYIQTHIIQKQKQFHKRTFSYICSCYVHNLITKIYNIYHVHITCTSSSLYILIFHFISDFLLSCIKTYIQLLFCIQAHQRV